jgi:hypothetical protein
MHLCDVKDGRLPDQKKPFPLQMTRFLVDRLAGLADMKSKMLRIAALMAYFMLLRQSEYIYSTKENNHAIQSEHVEFMFINVNEFIPSYEIRDRRFVDVESVRITLPHCKNDPFHRGNQFWYEAGNVSVGQFDIVQEIFVWAQLAGLRRNDAFLAYRKSEQEIVYLQYHAVSKAIKDTAIVFGLNPKLFGTHSWRIAGATTLHAAQVSMENIQLQGRWKSVNMPMHYSKSNRESFNLARSTLANESLFTVKDLLYHSEGVVKK